MDRASLQKCEGSGTYVFSKEGDTHTGYSLCELLTRDDVLQEVGLTVGGDFIETKINRASPRE